MTLIKPIIVFSSGYFFLDYYKKYKKNIKHIKIIGNDLYNLTEKHRDMVVLLLVSVISYFV